MSRHRFVEINLNPYQGLKRLDWLQPQADPS